MTPDEMKVLARVANRNNIESDSPIVLNSSRIVDIGSFEGAPLTIEEKVDQLMLNLHEAQQASQPNNDNSYSTVLGDIAEQVEKNKADISSVRNTLDSLHSGNHFDEINLNSFDVLLNVKKPSKLDSDLLSDHKDYTNILTHFSSSSANTKVYYINNLENAPQVALNLNDVDNSIVEATRINKEAVALGADFAVGSVNKVEIAQKRSSLLRISSLYTANVLDIDFRVENDSAKQLEKIVQLNIYTNKAFGSLGTTFLYLKTVGLVQEIWKHTANIDIDVNAVPSDLNNGTTSGVYYFQNGYLANLSYNGGSNKFSLDGSSVVQVDGLNTLYICGGSKYVLKAKGNVDLYDGVLSNVEMLKSNSALSVPLPIAGITKTNKLITIDTNGVATQITGVYTSGDYLFKVAVSGLLRLCKAGTAGLITALANTDYVFDKLSLKVSYNTTSGVVIIADGYYMCTAGTAGSTHNEIATAFAENEKLFKFVNGEINYTEFGVVGSVNNSGTVYFADENPAVIDVDTTNSPISQTYTLPASVTSATSFAGRAITLSPATAVATTFYIGVDGKLRKVLDGSIVTTKNGVYRVLLPTGISKFYSILSDGSMTPYNGLVFYASTGFYITVLLGVGTSLSTGVYVDNNNRVISVTAGAWNSSPAGGLNNDYIKIIDNNSFIIRKLVVQSDKNIFLMTIPDEYTDANALVNVGGSLYRIPAFNEPVIKAPDTYFVYSNDRLVLKKSASVTAVIGDALEGLYSWNANNANRVHQVKAFGQICWINGGNFNAFTYGTAVGNVTYPLFIEKKLVGAGKLFKYDPTKGALANLPEGRWWLPNYNNGTQESILTLGLNDWNTMNTPARVPLVGEYKNIYYEITSVSNKPVTSRLIKSDQILSGTYVLYLLDLTGMSSTSFSTGELYVTRPDNSLEHWVNGVRVAAPTDIDYISYDGKLSRTDSVNGFRLSVYTANYWVKLATLGTYHIFADGLEVIPNVGKMINVDTKSAGVGYAAENGIKIYRRNAANNGNEWASQVSGIEMPKFFTVNASTIDAVFTNARNGSIAYVQTNQTSGVFQGGAATPGVYILINEGNPSILGNWIKLN